MGDIELSVSTFHFLLTCFILSSLVLTVCSLLSHLKPGLMDHVKDLVGDFFDISSLRDWNLHADKIIIHPDYDGEGNYILYEHCPVDCTHLLILHYHVKCKLHSVHCKCIAILALCMGHHVLSAIQTYVLPSPWNLIIRSFLPALLLQSVHYLHYPCWLMCRGE